MLGSLTRLSNPTSEIRILLSQTAGLWTSFAGLSRLSDSAFFWGAFDRVILALLIREGGRRLQAPRTGNITRSCIVAALAANGVVPFHLHDPGVFALPNKLGYPSPEDSSFGELSGRASLCSSIHVMLLLNGVFLNGVFDPFRICYRLGVWISLIRFGYKSETCRSRHILMSQTQSASESS